MGKQTGILIGAAAAVVLVAGIFIGSYNGFAKGREAVSAAQADIDTMLTRRADLIPNLVSSVEGFISHENEVIDKVVEARAALAGAVTNEEKSQADEALTEAVKGLTVVVENYPELKSDSTYTALMDELSGSENRIAVARRDYNQAVRSYNNQLIGFPGGILAGLFHFEKAEYFEAAAGAEQVPDVGALLGK